MENRTHIFATACRRQIEKFLNIRRVINVIIVIISVKHILEGGNTGKKNTFSISFVYTISEISEILSLKILLEFLRYL